MTNIERISYFIKTLTGETIAEIAGEECVGEGKEFSEEDCGYFILHEVFTRGNCGNFACALNIVFPGGKIYLIQKNSNELHSSGKEFYMFHFIYEYEGHYFDVSGELDKEFIEDHEMIEYSLKDIQDDVVGYSSYSFKKRGSII